ncbi:unnamed protein product [Linum trigynum]|uniref:CCHC-type domain-containing protein n=2 Tax=Linum trigynum TaxID=586398 RepID=A0AAV2D2X2_9ROSI
MTVGSKPPSVEADHCLKPPDGLPATTPSQPSKRARASGGDGFLEEDGMDFAIVTARGTDEENLQEEVNFNAGNKESKPMETDSGGIKLSYKDSFLGNGPPEEIPEGEDLMSDESEGEEAEDDPDCPTIRLKKSTDARIRNRWKRAITFRVLGKAFPFAFIHRRIHKMWAKTGGVKIGDIGNGYFQAIFDSQLDHDRALYGGPWTIDDHYIASEPWRIDFDPDFDSINRASVWVRLPRLPLAYFDEEILSDIGDKLGRVEKINFNTANGSRGNYARICVEIDLRKRLVSKYRIERRVRRVEYEGLHTVCFGCGHYGHVEDSCPQGSQRETSSPEDRMKASSKPAEPEIRPEILEDFGPWMLATRNRRKPRPKVQQQAGGKVQGEEDQKKETSGSRFNVLEEESEEGEKNTQEAQEEEETTTTGENMEADNGAGKENSQVESSREKEKEQQKENQKQEKKKHKENTDGDQNRKPHQKTTPEHLKTSSKLTMEKGEEASKSRAKLSSGEKKQEGQVSKKVMASGTKGHNVSLQADVQHTSTSMANQAKQKNGMGKESSKDAKQGHQPKMKEMSLKNGKQGRSPEMKNKLSPENVKHPPRRISFESKQEEEAQKPENAIHDPKANCSGEMDGTAMAVDLV